MTTGTENSRASLTGVLLFCICLLGALECRPLHAQAATVSSAEISAAEMLPDTIVLYAEAPALASALDMLLTHPLRAKIESLPQYQHLMQSDQLVQLKSGVSLFEAGMGRRWSGIFQSLTKGGVYAAVDGPTEAVVVLIKADDNQLLHRIRDTVFPALRAGKTAGAEGDPIREINYRDITAYWIHERLGVAALDGWLVLTNKAEFGKQIVDRFLDRPSTGLLSSSSHYTKALDTRPADATLWGYAHISPIRDSGKAEHLYSGRTDNALAELLFGGIAGNLQHSDQLTFALRLQPEEITVDVHLPHQHEWVQESRTYYFGSDGRARAPALLNAPERLFALSAYRDISEMWLRAADLMTDKAAEQLAQADPQLTIFFSGKDFGEDILGALQPDIQLVGARQDFTAILPRPAIKLPAFAVQFRMKDREATIPQFRRIFQSFIGFINVVGAMEGQPQFDLTEERSDENWLISARYVPEEGEEQAEDAPINFNFSPTVVFVDDRFILASSRALGEHLAQANAASNEIDQGTNSPANTRLELNADTLHAILNDNRQQLISQSMLEEGHPREAAENQIDLLLALLDYAQQAELDLEVEPDQLQLRLQLRIELEAK